MNPTSALWIWLRDSRGILEGLSLLNSPERALVSAAVSLSLEAATCTASPPDVPLYDRNAPAMYSFFQVGMPFFILHL